MRTQERGEAARKKILALIRLREEGWDHRPPTIREISTAVGLSVASVHRHIGILVERHQLERDPKLARSVHTPYDDRGR